MNESFIQAKTTFFVNVAVGFTFLKNFRQTLRNVTGTTKHPFETRKEEMKQNSPNMFGTYKTKRKRFQIKWKILKKCKPYSNINKKCSLCLNEKFIIICKKELCSLNRRNELASSCPHRNRYVLGNFRVT